VSIQAISQYRLAKVRRPQDIAEAAVLFREYADWLGIDLSFQGFEHSAVWRFVRSKDPRCAR
jgi:hypothetical protein